MSNLIQDQPAMVELMANIQGQTGQPVLIIQSRKEALVNYALPPMGRLHPFDGTHTVYTYVLGILQSDQLRENASKQNFGLLFSTSAEKRSNNEKISTLEGPFWLTASGNQLMVGVLYRARVVVGPTNIVSWLTELPGTGEGDRLLGLCALFRALGIAPESYDDIRPLVTQELSRVREEAKKKFVALQSAIAELIRASLEAEKLTRQKNDLRALEKRLEILSGEKPPELVVYPKYE